MYITSSPNFLQTADALIYTFLLGTKLRKPMNIGCSEIKSYLETTTRIAEHNLSQNKHKNLKICGSHTGGMGMGELGRTNV